MNLTLSIPSSSLMSFSANHEVRGVADSTQRFEYTSKKAGILGGAGQRGVEQTHALATWLRFRPRIMKYI